MLRLLTIFSFVLSTLSFSPALHAAEDLTPPPVKQPPLRVTAESWLETRGDFKFDGATLKAVFESMKKYDSEINIKVDWASLEAQAVESSSDVTLELKNVTRRALLQSVLEEVSGGEVELAFEVDGDNTIYVTTRERILSIQRFLPVHVYSLSGLKPKTVTEKPKAPPAKPSSDKPSEGGLGGGTFGSDEGENNEAPEANWLDKEAEVIRELFSSELWKENGGNKYSMKIHHDSESISIRALRSTHQEIREWLTEREIAAKKASNR